MSFWPYFWLVLGLLSLLAGAAGVIYGAMRLSRRAGLSPLVTGLAILPLATSVPGLAVIVGAAVDPSPRPEIALGAVLGCVVAGMLLALGSSAAVAALAVPRFVARFSFPLLVAVPIVTLLIAWSGEFPRIAGGFFLLVGLAYVAISFRQGHTDEPRKRSEKKRRSVDAKPPVSAPAASLLLPALAAVIGLTATILGAGWMVHGASEVALTAGIGQLAMGLTIVALGASLPAIATAVRATLGGEREIAVGLAVGGGLIHLLIALGLAALLLPEGIAIPLPIFEFHLPAVIAATLVCVPTFYATQSVSRLTGLALLVFYAIYFAYSLSTDAVDAQPSESFTPMLVFTLGLLLVASLVAMAERLVQKARLADE